MSELDPKLTFDSFVVGPANRLASAAAKRAADSPGTSYNPLFLYSKPGLGKTHILTAIAHKSSGPDSDLAVQYMPLEEYLERLEGSLQAGGDDGVDADYGDLDILLLDDVQFLTGQPEAQEMLLKTLDQLTAAGGQIVLASDRPPADINGLDARLLSRFSGGLIVDLGMPEYETRVAIIQRKAAGVGQSLEGGVAEAVAAAPLKNIRELGGVLTKIFAIQELEDRKVTKDEVAGLLHEQDKAADLGGASDEFGDFLSELASTVAEVVEDREEEWRKAIRETIDAAERQGLSAARLEPLQDGSEPDGWEAAIEAFKVDVARLREIDRELERLGNPWPEAAQGVLEDPDRLEEAEALLTSVRERQRPFPRLADGPQLHDLDRFEALVVKAAVKLIGEERPEYNPMFVWTPDRGATAALLGAVGRTYEESQPGSRMAVSSVQAFASDFIRALGEGVAGAWRERWWTVDLLVMYDMQDLADTERAQDEFFHLFEALRRRGSRVLLAADRAPGSLDGLDERLRSRFEGGLVIELPTGVAGKIEFLEPELPSDQADAPYVPGGTTTESDDEERDLPVPVTVSESPQKGGTWFPSSENVVLQWPDLDDLLIEEVE